MQRQIIQSDFSGGEISSRMAMRADLEQYHRSLLGMNNFMPTLQGSAERTPGSRFVLDLDQSDENLRIIPYLTPANERGIVTITDTEVKLYPNIADMIAAISQGGGAQKANVQIIQRRQIVPNYTFFNGSEPWTLQPNAVTDRDGGFTGTKWLQGRVVGVSGINTGGKINASCTASVKATVPEATNTATMIYTIKYNNNLFPEGKVEVNVRLGTTAGAGDLYNDTFDDLEIGQTTEPTIKVDMPTTSWTGDIFITVEWTAKAGDDPKDKESLPTLSLERLGLWTDQVITIVDETVTGTPPWSADQLKDIHYIQSPYNRELDGAPSKELVLCHPQHPPQRLYLTGSGYVIEPIVFQNEPPGWAPGNYPSSCSSCLGRLVLAGGNLGPVAGSPVTSNTETVWATKVGKWNQFSQEDEVDPDDSLEFTTIYRSPIQWVFGQKELMIGAQEMEYIAMADGIFAPNDLGVAMHSSHGSANVQPVALGQEVLFAADGGTKVRAMSASNENVGFIAPDMTLWNPELCQTGIARMVRLRNPHQMVACLLKSGRVALLHQDPYAGISGWSNIDIGGHIYDIAVNTDENGVDTLYMTVLRDFDGVKKLYLEAIANWTEDNEWDYMASTYVYSAEDKFSTVPNLEHLEGQRVQVVGEQGYLGVYTVEAFVDEILGPVVGFKLVDDRGQPILTAFASVGLAMTALLRTLPIDGRSYRATGVGAMSRFSDISLRVRGSTKPEFGVLSFNEDVPHSLDRPETRHPIYEMERREPVDDARASRLEFLADMKLTNLGSDIYQTVIVRESLPLRVEVLGIYGKLASDSL